MNMVLDFKPPPPMRTTTNDQKIAALLRELALQANNGKSIYKRAATKAHDPKNRALFNYLSWQRSHFSNELNSLICRHGGNSEIDCTFSVKLKMKWLQVKDSLVKNRKNNDSRVIDYCLTYEKNAQLLYEHALGGTDYLPEDIKKILLIHNEARQTAFRKLSRNRILQPLITRFIFF